MVDRVFKSKIGWWYHLTVWVMAACTVLTFVKSNNIIGMIFLLLMTLFFIHSMLTTWYKITADGNCDAHLQLRLVARPAHYLQERDAVDAHFT